LQVKLAGSTAWDTRPAFDLPFSIAVFAFPGSGTHGLRLEINPTCSAALLADRLIQSVSAAMAPWAVRARHAIHGPMQYCLSHAARTPGTMPPAGPAFHQFPNIAI